MAFSVKSLNEEEYKIYTMANKMAIEKGYSRDYVHSRLRRGHRILDIYREVKNLQVRDNSLKYENLDTIDKQILSELKKIACKNNIGLEELKDRTLKIMQSENLSELLMHDINKVRHKDIRKSGNNLKAKCKKLGISYKGIINFKVRNAGYGWSDEETLKRYLGRPKRLTALCKKFGLDYKVVHSYKGHHNTSNEEAIIHFVPNAYINSMGEIVVKE